MKIAKTWNKQWTRSPVVYNARSSIDKKKRIEVDVRNFIWNKSSVLETIVNSITSPNDALQVKVWKIMRWVQNNITYIGDEKSSGSKEFWQFPAETIALRTGDCEDMSILMVSLIRVAGCPAYRIKVAAGLVKTGKNAETGGHAYPVYLREDDTWVVLDPCYYPTRTSIAKRPEHKNMSKYKDIWFTFNDEYTWAQKSFNLSGRLR